MDRTSSVYSQYCISVGFIGILLYLYGFFPIKTSTSIYSSPDNFPLTLQNIKFQRERLYIGSINKTVLMVIDGLRVDFVTVENMPYTGALVAEGKGEACQLTAKVAAPTVTLPRVKAIVTGTVSSFIDVVLNFGTKELSLDSVIEQASRTKKVVFYGDDTWIKLFPRQFIRSDGTSSFFVNDYTEVDDNVTRHLDSELQRSDWSLMVLHYLGLDHIGHIQGPTSPLIRPKLWEMDSIIARLHAYLQKERGGMLLVCGDHGMRDSGSHGGVSLPEVLVPVLVLGLSCPTHYKEEILQVDLATTLSILWGSPIPADSIGVVAAGLLAHLNPAQRLYAWLYNGEQLAGNFLRNGGSTLHESYRKYEEAKQGHYEWLSNSSTFSHHQLEAMYQASLLDMSRFLSEVFANYDTLALFSAIALVFQVLCILGLRLCGARFPVKPWVRSTLALSVGLSLGVMFLYRISFPSGWPFFLSFACSLIVTFNALLLCQQIRSLSHILKVTSLQVVTPWKALLPIGTLLFCLSLFSSSLLEEEHQLWYFLWPTIASLRLMERPMPWLWVLVTHRFLRSLNQTGDHWAHLPDLSDWLTLEDNQMVLSLLFVFSLLCVWWCCSQVLPRRLHMPLYAGSIICVCLHKAAVQQIQTIKYFSSSGVAEARLCWLLLAVLMLLCRSLDSLLVCWMVATSLLLRSYNTLLVPSLFLVSRVVCASPLSLSTTLLHNWLGAVFFFYQGNSNSLASIDVAAGYVGLEEYNAIVVGLLLFIHTYSMPILAYMLNIRAIMRQKGHWMEDVARSEEMVAFLQLLHVFFCLVVVTLHRYHLFVWSVFSPKLLYIGAHTLMYFLLISITNVCLYFVSKISLFSYK